MTVCPSLDNNATINKELRCKSYKKQKVITFSS